MTISGTMKRLFILIAITLFIYSAAYAQQTTLTLEQCLAHGGIHATDVRQSALSVLYAVSQQREARWEYVPHVGFHIMAYDALNPMLHITLRDVLGNSDAANVIVENITDQAYQNGIKPYYESMKKGFGASFSLMQPVYAGGRIRWGNRLADIGVEAAALQNNLERRAVRDTIESKYWRIVALQEKRETLLETLAMLDTLEHDVSTALASGLATEPDRMELHSKRGQAQAAMYRLDGSITLLKMDLLDYIGLDYTIQDLSSVTLAGSFDTLPTPEEVFRSAMFDVQQSDESRLLQLQVDAKRAERKMALGELMPQAAVGATYGYNELMSPQAGSFNGLVFATLQIPITDAGKANERARRYGYALQQAEEDRDYLMKRLVVRDGMLRLEVESRWRELSVAEEALNYAADHAQRVEVQYQSGQATTSELLRARLSESAAHDELLDKKIAYRIAVNAYLGTMNK